jgi:DMSO/TMAO reductase YedYZ heme-binding membrane subunit
MDQITSFAPGNQTVGRAGVAGQAFLAACTLATLLLVPLAITSNR